MPSLKKLWVLFFLCICCSSSYAVDLEDWVNTANLYMSKVDHKSKPYTVSVVKAATPSKVFFGYAANTQACILFVNQSADLSNSTKVEIVVSVLHEIGHCLSIREGHLNIEAGVTRLGESVADAYAIAWIYANEPAMFEEAFATLCAVRMSARRLDAAYDTLMAIKTAKHALEKTSNLVDPYKFTAELFKL